jgi:NADPH:quinone reductase
MEFVMRIKKSNTMQAVVVTNQGGVDKLELTHITIPIPSNNEVLIKIIAAGVNRADIEQRKSASFFPGGVSPILGLEVAGLIVAIGNNVNQFRVGDRVMALVSGGGYAEYVLAHAGICLSIPENMDYVQAAAVPEASFTVWSMLLEAAKLSINETLLIHGGTGGVGSFAIQLAHQFSIKVIATAGTDEKCRICYSLGADKVINYKKEDFFFATQEFMNNSGVDVILDLVGGDYIERNLNLLRRGGRLAFIDSQGNSITTINLLPIITRNLMIIGGVLTPRPTLEKISIAEEIQKYIIPLLSSGKIKPLISKTFSLGHVHESHKFLESGHQIGKVVLTVSN